MESLNTTNSNLIQMHIQVSRVAIHAVGSGIHQLILAEPSGEQTDPQSASTLSGKSVPDTVANHHTILQAGAKFACGGKK
jgi:hypothetical protein